MTLYTITQEKGVWVGLIPDYGIRLEARHAWRLEKELLKIVRERDEEAWQKILIAKRKAGWSLNKIKREFGVGDHYLSDLLKAAGVSQAKVLKARLKRVEARRDRIIQDYRELASSEKVASKNRCSVDTVQRVLREAKLLAPVHVLRGDRAEVTRMLHKLGWTAPRIAKVLKAGLQQVTETLEFQERLEWEKQEIPPAKSLLPPKR